MNKIELCKPLSCWTLRLQEEELNYMPSIYLIHLVVWENYYCNPRWQWCCLGHNHERSRIVLNLKHKRNHFAKIQVHSLLSFPCVVMNEWVSELYLVFIDILVDRESIGPSSGFKTSILKFERKYWIWNRVSTKIYILQHFCMHYFIIAYQIRRQLLFSMCKVLQDY